MIVEQDQSGDHEEFVPTSNLQTPPQEQHGMKKLTLPALALAMVLTACDAPTSNILPGHTPIAHAG